MKITSVQYIVEQSHAYFEAKDKDGYTLINNPLFDGHLDIVEFLYKRGHQGVEIKSYDILKLLNILMKHDTQK